MIQRNDILSIPYLKKSIFSGSYQGMRYRLEKIKEEENEADLLKVTIWAGPYGFDTTKEEKEAEKFAFSEEGICQAVEWLNKSWEGRKDYWRNARNNW